MVLWGTNSNTLDLKPQIFQSLNGGSCSCTISDETKLLASDGAAGDIMGEYVRIDGDRAIIGAKHHDANGGNSGALYVFERDCTSWSQTAKIVPADNASYDIFGGGIALDGNRIAVSASFDDDNGGDSGSVYVFEYDGSNWNQTAKITTDSADANGTLGHSFIDMDGDRIIASGLSAVSPGTDVGSVYVFDYDGSSWSQTAELVGSDSVAGDLFGGWGALDGDLIVVSASYDTISGMTAYGSVFVFEYDGSSWSETEKIITSQGNAWGWMIFGSGVDLSGDRIAVGAHNDGASNEGLIHIFEYDGSNWNQTALLDPADTRVAMGFDVALDGGKLLAGTSDYLNTVNGKSYYYEYDGSSWNLTQIMTASDGANNDYYGYRGDVDGESIAISAFNDDDNGADSGSLYVYGGCN